MIFRAYFQQRKRFSSRLPVNFDSPAQPNAAYIESMFDRMARRYDTFTLLTGFGQAQRWRAAALADIRPGMRVLDIGCGTGDLTLDALDRVGPTGGVVGLDFSAQMLEVAASKHRRRIGPAAGTLRLVRRCAEDLPMGSERFDCVVSGFVLRNLYERIDRILVGIRQSLHQGGEIRFLDLTEPEQWPLDVFFRWYLMIFAGLYGAFLFGKDYPIPYLPDSAKRFLKARDFTKKLTDAGFSQVRMRSFMFGTVTLYQAVRS